MAIESKNNRIYKLYTMFAGKNCKIYEKKQLDCYKTCDKINSKLIGQLKYIIQQLFLNKIDSYIHNYSINIVNCIELELTLNLFTFSRELYTVNFYLLYSKVEDDFHYYWELSKRDYIIEKIKNINNTKIFIDFLKGYIETHQLAKIKGEKYANYF